MKTSRSHDAAMAEMLQNDPGFAADYLLAALDELHEEGGEGGFLDALHQIVAARCAICVQIFLKLTQA